MEHNQQEAEALAKWLTSSSGQRYYVIPVPKDTVKYALTIRPQVVRHPWRQEAFEAMGVV